MKNFLIYAMVVMSILMFSCAGNKKNNQAEEQALEKGKIITKVKCQKNRTQSYAAFIPSNYSEDKKCPVIFCFDPSGNGVLPLEILRDDAEKLGYILIGSNVSKNGLAWDVIADHYDVMLTDVSERLEVDSSRIYTCGFSGGSRVASSIAILKGGISSVIGCSAGLPQLKEAIKTKFDYIGFAGKDDMNFAEMVNLDGALEKNNIRHQLVVFEGTHAWPPKEVLTEAYTWMELHAMRDKKKPEDKDYINKKLSEYTLQLDEIKKSGNKYKEYLQTKKMLTYFKGLTDIAAMEESLKTLQDNAAVKNGIDNSLLNLKKELAMQQKYAPKINTESAAWWKNEVAYLNKFVAISPNEDEKHIVKRVLEYLSLSAYSASNSLYKQNNFVDAEHYIEIYSIIDADNPEPAFMMAQLSARKKDAVKTMEHLKRAASLGFAERTRVDNDTVFLKFKEKKGFSDIIDIISANQNKK